MLEATDIFNSLARPASIGAARLGTLALPQIIAVAPYKGQGMAVADTLRPLIGIILPPRGQLATHKGIRALWVRRGQWLLLGEADLTRQIGAAVAGMAAVADMSDAFGGLLLSGDAAIPVLSRLCALDLERLKTGTVAQTTLADIPVVLIAVDGGFELLVPRSYAGSTAKRLEVAMRSVAAHSAL